MALSPATLWTAPPRAEKAATDRNRDELSYKQKMFELKTERLKAVVGSPKVTKGDGHGDSTVRTMRKIEAVLAKVADPSDP